MNNYGGANGAGLNQPVGPSSAQANSQNNTITFPTNNSRAGFQNEADVSNKFKKKNGRLV